MSRRWREDEILLLARGYQSACVLAAAADLGVFGVLAAEPLTARDVAHRLGADTRGAAALLDALVALELLNKQDGRYAPAEGASELLTPESPGSVLAMVRHQANCLRRWSRMAESVRSGRPVERQPSIRGEAADQAAFIEAMDNVCRSVAGDVVADLGPPPFKRLLDVGGASGTWTIAFLRANPDATATLFDLPVATPLAEQRLAAAGLRDRVRLVAGDFLADPLPAGHDLAWVSAIIHQNSRDQNRRLFRAVHQAMTDNGTLLIRDIVMDESRTTPVAGALFALNMLTATEGGGTFTLDEIRADLQACGFCDASIIRPDEGMNTVVRATRAQ